MLLLFLVSYLAPKESYRKYFHFYISVWMVIILMRPILNFAGEKEQTKWRQELAQIEEELGQIEYYEKGESMIEQFFGEAEKSE
jgi:hypothetical protein